MVDKASGVGVLLQRVFGFLCINAFPPITQHLHCSSTNNAIQYEQMTETNTVLLYQSHFCAILVQEAYYIR
jgi:hypothetical protein